jgi:hypothetical protein
MVGQRLAGPDFTSVIVVKSSISGQPGRLTCEYTKSAVTLTSY